MSVQCHHLLSPPLPPTVKKSGQKNDSIGTAAILLVEEATGFAS